MPSARKLIAVPETIWSARRLTEKTAWSRPMTPPAASPIRIAADPARRDVGAPGAEERAGEHHPLEADVDHAGALGGHAAERGEGQRRRVAQRRGQQRGPDDDALEVGLARLDRAVARRARRPRRRRPRPSPRAARPARSATTPSAEPRRRRARATGRRAHAAAAAAPGRTRARRARRRPSRSTPRATRAPAARAGASRRGRRAPAALAGASESRSSAAHDLGLGHRLRLAPSQQPRRA